ncbi:GNAT family N-acetyltransferase [Brucella sp. HL-2]|nr:GNAT family N-acetyltransferase [Brucella sp. HL-2]MCV9910050.1 GNAT family N-acetyltransferase [Brucella sp. HL-2]
MADTASPLEIKRITSLPIGFELFLKEAASEGFNNMSTLQSEWNDGSNIFDRPGEILALATINGEPAGIGGITRDFIDSTWLRMRRFYVRPAYRRRGVGRGIAHFVLNHALQFNAQISLYADGAEARTFWPTLGFVETDRQSTTHIFNELPRI